MDLIVAMMNLMVDGQGKQSARVQERSDKRRLRCCFTGTAAIFVPLLGSFFASIVVDCVSPFPGVDKN